MACQTVCSGDPIPRIDYTPEEVAVWGTALANLKGMYPKHACKEFNRALPKFNFRWAPNSTTESCWVQYQCCCKPKAMAVPRQ